MFVKGISGNPGGRPKGLNDVTLEARKLTPLCIRELKRILSDPSARDQSKVKAAEVLLNRAWGKAPVVFSGEGGEGPATFTILLDRVTSDEPTAGG
jgi:hypothetical protein